MASIRQLTPIDVVITCIKPEGVLLKLWALPFNAVEAVKEYEKHFIRTGNDLANRPGFTNCSQIPPGFLYAAFSQIRKQWCRARILRVLGNSTLIIHLIDYGDEEQLLCTDIRKLDDNLSDFNVHAIECILGDVKPTNNIWSPEALKMCEEQLLYDTVSCFMVSQHLEVPVVRIAKKGEKEPFVQRLINNGLAMIKPETSQLAQPVVPKLNYKINMLDRNTTHLVKISFVQKPYIFYVQLAVADVELTRLMDEIKQYTTSGNLIPLNSPQLNTPCLAQFSGKQLFYRGIITAIKQNQYSVHFVDYGYSELKDHNELIVIPNHFLALPTQAICCTIPQGDVNVEEFRKIINCKLVECHVLGHNGDAYIVKLAPYSQESIVQRSSPPVSKSQMWTYQHQKLNLNTTHDVTVSYNNGVSEFYCQLNVHKKQLDDISDVLNSGIEMEPLSLADCIPNLPVCVKFSEDNVWYRAQIIKINHEHDIEVFFVDYGNYDNASLRDVCKMRADLMVCPVLALKCSLYNVELPEDPSKRDEMFDLFEELTSEETLAAHFHAASQDQCYIVTLLGKNASTSINDKIKSKFLTVASVAVSNVEQLYITCFESPSNFFAQFEKLSSEKLEEMQNGINNHYLNASKSSFKPKTGTIVCAKYSMDNLFYRARIENVVDDNCNVIFIDYGNKETVSLSNIHPLDNKFMIHPPFGIECGLHTYPPATPVEKLQGLMLENSVQAKMIKEENKKWLIALTEDFTGNVAILELLRQHEAVVPRSIHGAGLRGFQEHMTPKENTSFNNNEVHKPRNNFQNPNKFNAGKPQSEIPFNKTNTFSPTSREERNEPSFTRNNKFSSTYKEEKNVPPFTKNNVLFSSSVKEEKNESLSFAKSFDITSIPSKAYRNVFITHVVSPSEFYCQIEEDISKLKIIMNNIENVYANLKDNEMKLVNPTIGSPCCAMYQKDAIWCRAQIKQINSETYTVFFIDYGNTDVVPISKVKQLKSEFLNLPPQAICCRSYNVTPVSDSWREHDIKTFINMTFDKNFVAQFVQLDKNDVYSVNLVPLGKLQQDVLNKEFVSMGHGRLEDSNKIIVLNSHAASSNLTFPVPVVKFGSFEDVTVTYGLNPVEVFCQLKSSEKYFKKLMFEMQEYYNQVPIAEALIDRPHVGMICVSQFSQDSVWYRSQIKKVEQNLLVVLYVDYGNSETVDKKKIRSITQDFTLMPIQGIKCCLKGIKAPENKWSINQNIGKYFEGNVQCQFIEKKGDSYVVDMICNNENVAEKLVKDGLATTEVPVKNADFSTEVIKAVRPQIQQLIVKRETPFVPGQLLSVTVSFVESPFKFWCQLLDETAILDQLMADIESRYSEAGTNPVDASILIPGTYCMAKYSADEVWYRAQIKSCLSEGYEVFFIDYGNSEVTALSELAVIHPEFLKIPPLCFECRLLRASVSCSDEKTAEFQAAVDDTDEITAKVESINDNIYTLSLLFDKDGEEVNVSQLIFGFEEESETSLPVEVPKFLHPNVPLGNQEGYVTVVNTPHDFFIQLATCEDSLNELSSELSEICDSASSIQNPNIGYACCAKFSEDNNWYRAEIVSLQETMANVIFVDYGNTDFVPINSLKYLNEKFLGIPPYAISCKLNGIVSTCEQWPEVAINAFQDMVLDCPLGITFVSKDIPAIVNISKDDKDVAQSLIDMELANVDTCPETEEAYADDHLTTVEDQLHSLPSDLSYPQRKLSSSKLPVKISYVDSYDKFYIMPLELSTELDTVMKTLEILYSSETRTNDTKASAPDVLEDPSISLPCVAKHSEDEAWYRAIITDIDGDNIYIFFVDYGYSEVSSLKNLRPLTPELIKIPPIAIECKMYAIQANEGKEPEIIKKLEEYFIEEMVLDMEVFQFSEPYEIRLYHNCNDLAEMLCQNGLTTEVIPPLEAIKDLQLVENLSDDMKNDLKTASVELSEVSNDSSDHNSLTTKVIPTEIIHPLENIQDVQLVENLNNTVKDDLKASYMEYAKVSEDDTSKKELHVNVKFLEIENDIIVLYAIPSEDDNELSDFQERLQIAYNETEQKVSKVNYSGHCVTKSTEDDNWYRAQVIDIDSNNVTVKFIDYGNSEIVQLEDIRELCAEFASEPPFITKFCLSGYRVKENHNDEVQNLLEEWLYDNDDILFKLYKYSCNFLSTCIIGIVTTDLDMDFVKSLLDEHLILPQYIVNAQLDSKFEATIESISEDIFYLLPVQFVEERNKFKNCLRELCSNKSAYVSEVDPKSLYAVEIDDCWSRASITNINNQTKCAFVKCIDNGFETEVEFEKLALLPKSLWHQPLLVHQCIITNFEDAPSSIKTKDMKNIVGQIFLCEIDSSSHLKYPLRIKLFEKDSCLALEKTPNCSNVKEEPISEINKSEAVPVDLEPTDFEKSSSEVLENSEAIEIIPNEESKEIFEINSTEDASIDLETTNFGKSSNEVLENSEASEAISDEEQVENFKEPNYIDKDIFKGDTITPCQQLTEDIDNDFNSPSKNSEQDIELSNDSSQEESLKLMSNDPDLLDAESDLVTKELCKTYKDNSNLESDESFLDNFDQDVNEKEQSEALQDIKVDNHEVKLDELENLSKSCSIEDNEWDERPECDIKQISEQFEIENCEMQVTGKEICTEEETSCQMNDSDTNIDNFEICSEHEITKGTFEVDSSENEAKAPDVDFTSDKDFETSNNDSDLTDLLTDNFTYTSHQQLSGKVDVYVSDMIVSDGQIILTVIPYDLHLKLVSTFNETFQSMYAKKESGLKDASVSDLCAVYSDDRWFRGKILSVDSDKLKLLLIDYGITKIVDKSSAVDLDPIHKKIPPFAIQCTLASIYCSPEKSEDTKNFLSTLLENVQGTGKDVSIEIIKTGDPQQVNLFLVGNNILFELLSQKLVIQVLSEPNMSSGKYSAKTSHISISPGKFQLYVNLVNDLENLRDLQDSMNCSYPSNTEKTTVVESGVYSILHKDTWHRGTVKSSDDRLQFFLVDSGETISLDSDLYPLHPEHCMQPPFAIPCQFPGSIHSTDEILSDIKNIFTLDDFIIYVDVDSESHSLSAKIMDEVLLEKIKSLTNSGQ